MQIAGYEYGGKYKTGDNYIIEEDKDGNRKVRFKFTPAYEVKEAMEQQELAYMEARNDAIINQLLLIPCVVLDFLCIHPFRDGNGRMSLRVLVSHGTLQSNACRNPVPVSVRSIIQQ